MPNIGSNPILTTISEGSVVQIHPGLPNGEKMTRNEQAFEILNRLEDFLEVYAHLEQPERNVCQACWAEAPGSQIPVCEPNCPREAAIRFLREHGV